MRLDELRPSDYNPRIISEEAAAGLAASLNRFGLVEPLIANKRTGYTIVGGHQRLAALAAQGVKEAQVIVVDLPAREEKELNIALNNLSGDWDYDKLRVLLGELKVTDSERQLLGFADKELDELLRWGEAAGAAPDDVGKSVEDAKDIYDNNVIRQIVLYFDADDYVTILAKLKQIAESRRPPLETHSDVFTFLLDFYETHRRQPARA